ncbi:MAG TPA: hypothetical protein VID72_11760 [Ktedonobacterales bacterium]
MIKRESPGRRAMRGASFAALALVALLTLALSACGSTAPTLPSGAYTNQQYHFSVTYPAGWQVNTSAQPGATAPLIIIITRSGTHQPPGSQISSLTIDVLDLSDTSVAKTAAALSKNSALSKITFGGQPGFSDKPMLETGASETQTHSDYYVAHGAYLYQVSTDALAGDSAALNTMAQSFTILS